MISGVTAALLRLLAIGYGLFGALLILAPEFAAPAFAWRVEPLAVMTMGGWCLGNAAYAWTSARIARWSTIAISVLYLGGFGIFEAAVAWMFQGAIRWQAALTPWYIALLILNVVTALVAFGDWFRTRAPLDRGERMRWWERAAAIGFVAFVAFLAYRGSLARAGGLSTEGGIFPTKLTLFSVRAFAAFYLALALAALPAIWMRSADAWIASIRNGMWLIVPITGVALLHLGQFDFGQRPGGAVYIAVYLIAFAVALGILTWRGRPRTAVAPDTETMAPA